MTADVPAEPLVRVLDAGLVSHGGPAELVLVRLPGGPARLGDAVASSGGRASVEGERLRVVATPARVVAAAGRTGGASLAARVDAAIDAAITHWSTSDESLVLGDGPLDLSGPVVLGVVNTTPDSFSDGGVHATTADAVAHGRRLVAEGAALVDVGGESTRPGAPPVDVETELARVVPVVAGLVAAGVRVSVDTTKARVAREAVAAGAVLVNDISAGRLDPDLLPTVAELGVGYVAMHMQGTPRTMQAAPAYEDVTAEVFEALAGLLDRLVDAGVPAERVAVDPGIGFGKTLAHNVTLLHDLRQLRSLGRPVLVGASRKRFVGELTGVTDPKDRLAGSLGAAATAIAHGAMLVRVHDVAATVEAVRVAHAIRRA